MADATRDARRATGTPALACVVCHPLADRLWLATNLGDVSSPAAFYFDLASPLAYLAAERVLHVLGGGAPVNAEWRPVLADELAGTRRLQDSPQLRAQVERRAQELGLQPVRWPRPFPFDSALSMRVATYAASIGRTVPFAQAAFRQAFAGGHSLADPDFVLIAAAACEMHPAAVLRGADMRANVRRLVQATTEASRAGVTEVPAIVAGERTFVGESSIEDAAAYMRAESVAAARKTHPS